MKYYAILLLLSCGAIHTMNIQIIPVDDNSHAVKTQGTVEDDSSSGSSNMPLYPQRFQTPSSLSDIEICRQVLSNINPSSHLLPHLAKHLKGKQDIEAGNLANIVVQAANDALEAKHEEVNNRVAKKHVGYIGVGITIVTTVITALASMYQCKI